ncbi:MAG: hypothetical protein CVV07_08730 [Gammaproteobacteria bacterium HGW-Gammaproteobacteria-11]|nr:MAG: hypothetical protein CVV07_08730 [Gammaproteobacteria bacterium HGW-Gammaproteobacteria-11]
MSKSSQFVSSSIEQVLLGLARGLRDAQAVLDEMPPTDSYGRPRSSYHLPYLDFTIKATMETTQQGNESEPSRNLGVNSARIKKLPLMHLKLPSLKANAEPSNNSTELTSTFSGRLVSIPPSNNLPTNRLLTRAMTDAQKPEVRHIQVNLSNTVGDRISGAGIEFNLDIETSLKLSQLAGVAASFNEDKLKAAVRFSQRVVMTDDAGDAAIEIQLDKTLPANANVVVLISSGPTMTQLILSP